MDIKIIIGNGNDAWRVTELLKKKNIPVLAASIHRLPEKNDDAYDGPFLLPKNYTMQEFSIASLLMKAATAIIEIFPTKPQLLSRTDFRMKKD